MQKLFENWRNFEKLILSEARDPFGITVANEITKHVLAFLKTRSDEFWENTRPGVAPPEPEDARRFPYPVTTTVERQQGPLLPQLTDYKRIIVIPKNVFIRKFKAKKLPSSPGPGTMQAAGIHDVRNLKDAFAKFPDLENVIVKIDFVSDRMMSKVIKAEGEAGALLPTRHSKFFMDGAAGSRSAKAAWNPEHPYSPSHPPHGGSGDLTLEITLSDDFFRAESKELFLIDLIKPLRAGLIFTTTHELEHFQQGLPHPLRGKTSRHPAGHLEKFEEPYSPEVADRGRPGPGESPAAPPGSAWRIFVYELLPDEFEANIKGLINTARKTGYPLISNYETVYGAASQVDLRVAGGFHLETGRGLFELWLKQRINSYYRLLRQTGTAVLTVENHTKIIMEKGRELLIKYAKQNLPKIHAAIMSQVEKIAKNRQLLADPRMRLEIEDAVGRPTPKGEAVLKSKKSFSTSLRGAPLMALDLSLRLEFAGPEVEEKAMAVFEWGRDTAIWTAIGAASTAVVGAASPGVLAGMIISCMVDPTCHPPKSRKEAHREKIKTSEAGIDAAIDMCRKSGMVPDPLNPRGLKYRSGKPIGGVECVTPEEAEERKKELPCWERPEGCSHLESVRENKSVHKIKIKLLK